MTLEQLGIVIGILSAACGSVYFCVNKYSIIKLRNRPRFKQSWTNEGDVNMGSTYTHFIYLEITHVEHGELVGIMQSKVLNNNLEYDVISVNGAIGLKSAIVTLIHRNYPCGKAKLTLHKSRLKWKLIKGDKTILPDLTVMWKNKRFDYEDLFL